MRRVAEATLVVLAGVAAILGISGGVWMSAAGLEMEATAWSVAGIGTVAVFALMREHMDG